MVSYVMVVLQSSINSSIADIWRVHNHMVLPGTYYIYIYLVSYVRCTAVCCCAVPLLEKPCALLCVRQTSRKKKGKALLIPAVRMERGRRHVFFWGGDGSMMANNASKYTFVPGTSQRVKIVSNHAQPKIAVGAHPVRYPSQSNGKEDSYVVYVLTYTYAILWY